MKYLFFLFIVIVFNSCESFLMGHVEKKLTWNEFTPYIQLSKPHFIKNYKFYFISFDEIKEGRGYPNIIYGGTENNYSIFWFGGTKIAYHDEISFFYLPDSLCINKFETTIEQERNRWGTSPRRAHIIDNKMVVDDLPKSKTWRDLFR